MVVNLAGSSQVQPTYWLNRDNGVTYNIVMQMPQYRLDLLSSLSDHADRGARRDHPAGAGQQRRWEARRRQRRGHPVRPAEPVRAGLCRRCRGAISARPPPTSAKVIKELAPQQSNKIRSVQLQGQVRTMDSAFSGLLFGLLGSVVLFYLLIVVNFPSWSDPFILITALPAALAGIVWMLFLTHTTLSVPGPDGRHHVHGRSDGVVPVLVISFARGAADRPGRCDSGRPGRRLRPLPPCDHDGPCHDHRHAANVPRLGGGRRTERAAWSRGDRWPGFLRQ